MENRSDRRAFLRSLGIAGAAVASGSLLSACAGAEQRAAGGARPRSSAGPAAASGNDRLRVGYLPITDASPLLIAHARDLYADEGLQVERPTLLRSWPQVAEAFQARQVDIVHLLMPMTVALRFGQSFPLKVVAWNHTDGSALTVRNDVEDLSQLAGTTVAVPFWYSIHNVALQMLFASAGLTAVLRGEPSVDERTVKLVVMAPPDMPPALAAQSIAGYIVADPFNALAEVQDVGRILRFTGDVWLNHACCVTVMHEDAIAERPEWAQATLTALVKAQRWTRDNRIAAAEILSRDGEGYLPQPLASVQRALTYYDTAEYGPTGAIQHPQWHNNRIDFQPFPFPSYTQELVARMQNTHAEGDRGFLDQLTPGDVHADLVDDTLVRTAIDAAGGPEAFGLPADLTRTETIDV